MGGAQFGAEQAVQAEHEVGLLGGVGGGAVEGDVGEGEAVAAGAGDGVECRRGVGEVAGGGLLERVAVGAGAAGVGDQHDVVEGGERGGETVLGRA